MGGGGGVREDTQRAQSGRDKRVCSHATAAAYRRFHKHRRLFVVDKRISMSMLARRQRGGAATRRRQRQPGAIDGEVSDAIDGARRRRRLTGC